MHRGDASCDGCTSGCDRLQQAATYRHEPVTVCDRVLPFVGMSGEVPTGLTPFRKGDPRASEAGRKGVAARRAKQALQRADSMAIARELATIAETHDRSMLGPTLAAVAMELAGRVARGEIPVRNGDEAATLVRTFVDIARLEAGQATSHSVHATISPADALARIEELQRAARQALSATATAADDVTPSAVELQPAEVEVDPPSAS